MKQIKFLGVVALALSLGLAACNGGGNSKGSSKHTHTWGDYTQVKAATCTEKGQEKRVCSGCQQEQTRDIPALGHQFLEGDADVKTDVVAATCEEAGSYKHTCQRCQQPITETVAALGHDWEDAADQSEAIAPTCTEAGTKIQVCKNNPAHKQEVEVEALGHDFSNPHKLDIPGPTETNTKGEIPFQWAEITNYSCSRGDSYRYAWSAKEVNFDYANEGVHWTQEEIDAAVEGDPAYGKTTADWKSEPNLLDDGEGVRFFGRPINNAMPLNNAGDAADRGNTPKIPDPTVKGSRFEFDFVFDADLTDVCLSAEFTPAQYVRDLFKNEDGVEDWTPGYKNVVPAVDEEGNPVLDADGNPTYTGEMIAPFRFIILLDGEEVELDKTVSTRGSSRAWYQFPCKLNLSKGKHNLNIAMAGGYRHVFYNFAFEKVAPAHEHRWTVGDKAADSALRPMTCRCEATGYELQAADLTSGQKAPTAGNDDATKNTRLGKGSVYDDVWNVTGIAAGTYDVYMQAQCSRNNKNAYMNAATAIANGDRASNNGSTAELQGEHRYKIKVDDGTYTNIGEVTAKYSDYGWEEDNGACNWSNKPVATITVAAGATSITVHNMNNGYAIWVFGLRLVKAAA